MIFGHFGRPGAYFRGPGAHAGGPRRHFEDFWDSGAFGGRSSVKGDIILIPKCRLQLKGVVSLTFIGYVLPKLHKFT